MALIGINGYAKSGKDAAAKLIQFLYMRDRDITIEDAVNNRQFSFILEMKSNWQIKKYSYLLKKIASLLTGFDIEQFEDQDFKESLLPAEWGLETKTPLSNIPVFEDMKFIHLMTVREFLQKLGTDAVRDGLHPNAWVNAAMSGYKPVTYGYDANGSPVSIDQNWIFTDCRFPNEAQAIKDRGGYIIRIDRPDIKPVNNHTSETALDDWDFDFKVYNAGDLVTLCQSMEVVMDKIIKL